jgi:hypothetical protein
VIETNVFPLVPICGIEALRPITFNFRGRSGLPSIAAVTVRCRKPTISANKRHWAWLFDHLVGASEQRRRDTDQTTDALIGRPFLIFSSFSSSDFQISHHPPAIQQGNHSIRQVFTQSGPKDGVIGRPQLVDI